MFFIALFIVTLLTVTQAQAGSVDYLEWQLPDTGDACSIPSVRFKSESQLLTRHDIKTSSFTGEVEVTGHAGQRFILCAKNIGTDAYFQTEATITSRTGTYIYLLQLIETTARLSIEHSYPCPTVYSSQYPYSSALHLHSNAPFLVTYKAEPEKPGDNTGVSLPFPSLPAHPLSFILPNGKGGSDNDGDDGFRRPGFGPTPDKTGFDLLLLPALLPGNWQGYQSFFRLYQWLTNDRARPPGLTLLLRFDNQPPIRLSISLAEYADMAEHLLNIRQLLQWLAPRLNGREQLIQKMLGISSQERFLPAETIHAVRRQLALVLEQNDNDFSIEFEFSELLRTLAPAEETEEINLPGLHLSRPDKKSGSSVSGVLNYPVTTDDPTSNKSSSQASGESGNSGSSGNNGASHSEGATGSGASSGSGSGNNGRDRDDNKPPAKLITQCDASAIKGTVYLYMCKIVVCEEEAEYSLTLVDNEYLPFFICGICQNICNNPHFFCREHSFCKDCIATHKKHSPAKTCPCCRGEEQVVHEHLVLRQMIEISRVYCPHKNSGCQDTPQIDQLKTHLEQCPYHVVHCKNQGCLLTYPSTEHPDHQKTCLFRTIDCVNSANGCKQKVIWNGMDAHTENCSYQRILCPDCEGEILRHQSDKHKNQCPSSAIAHSPQPSNCVADNRRDRYPLYIEPDYDGSDSDTPDYDYYYCDFGKKAILREIKDGRLYAWNNPWYCPLRTTYFYVLDSTDTFDVTTENKSIKTEYNHFAYGGHICFELRFKVRRCHDYLAVSYKHLNPDTAGCTSGYDHFITMVEVGIYSRTGEYANVHYFHFDDEQFYKVSDKQFLPVADIPESTLPGDYLVFYTRFYYAGGLRPDRL